MHPLFSTAMSSPGLLLAHASAYAELATVELEETLSWHQRRLQVCALMWLQLCLAFVLLSVSFMFHVALGETLPQSRALWLWLPPALSVTGALACGLWLRGQGQQAAFPQLRQQVRQDIDWLQNQGGAHG
jgi:cytochrome bd-type quinol oxidase subunit 2